MSIHFRKVPVVFSAVLLTCLYILICITPAQAIKVYLNPSNQTNNVSPDGVYNEGYAMQDVSDRAMVKFNARGVETRNSHMMTLQEACDDSNSWGPDCFVAMHTNAVSSGWNTAHGTEGFYYQSPSGSYDTQGKVLATDCVKKVVEKFNFWGRGYNRGAVADYPYFNYNLYVLKYTDARAILVEGLFHDNQPDVAVLETPEGKDAYAEGIYEGVCDFYGMSYNSWDSSVVNASFPTIMAPGQTATAWIDYKNTGTSTWFTGNYNNVVLGTANPQNHGSSFFTSGNWISNTRPSGMCSTDCGPGGTARFSFTLTAPQQPGVYNEYWQLYSAMGGGYFGDATCHFTITVVSPKGKISGKITNASTGNALNGATVSLNTGASTTSDTNGAYSFDNLDAGTYTVTVAKSGFYTNKATPSVTLGNTSTCNIALALQDTQSPTTPTQLTAKAIGSDQVALNWSPSADNFSVTGYEIYRNGSPITFVNTNSYTDTSLSPTTRYTYQVSAKDEVDHESGLSNSAAAVTLPGPVVVFSDGFTDLSNWQGDPDSSVNLTLDSSQNHNLLTGSNSAKATATQSRFMYHYFSNVFSSGKYEAWFYDSGITDANRQGIHVRGYSGSDLAFTVFLGTYSPNGQGYYHAGVNDGTSWSWTSSILTRSVGWHKLGIELLPYTGSGDLKFYIDGNLEATMNRPANSNTYGISRIYIGHNYPINIDGWYDDVTFTSEAPDYPTLGIPTPLDTNHIQWNFTDNSDNETGWGLLDSSGNILQLASGSNKSSLTEAGLSPNTVYTRGVFAYNGTLKSSSSDLGDCCTLSAPPSASTIQCNQAVNAETKTPQFLFTAVGGFGEGTLQYYRYVFDQNPTHAFNGSETTWSSGDLACSASSDGNWYLHLIGYNTYNVSNGTFDMGPFIYNGTAPVISEVSANHPTSTSMLVTWKTDEPATSQVEYGDSTAYSSISSLDTHLVTSHSVAVTGLTAGTLYHYRVHSKDASGNEAISLDYTLSASQVFSSPADFVNSGWNLISLPATPLNADPVSVLQGIDVPNANLQYWQNDVNNGGFQVYGSTYGWTGPLNVGIPYWFYEMNGKKTLSFEGMPNLTDWKIQIPAHISAPYWVLIGQPFDHSTDISKVTISTDPSHLSPLGWLDASQAGIISSMAQGYESAKQQFFTVGESGGVADKNQFDPWYGYWVLVFSSEPITFTIPVAE